MPSLAGPHKVMLNSRRHYELLTMLRGPHLTSATVELSVVLRSTCIDSYSVADGSHFFSPFFFLMKPAPLMKTNRSSLMSPCIRKPPPQLQPGSLVFIHYRVRHGRSLNKWVGHIHHPVFVIHQLFIFFLQPISDSEPTGIPWSSQSNKWRNRK